MDPILQAAEVQNIRVAVVPNLRAAEDPSLPGAEDPNLQAVEDLGLVDQIRTEDPRHPAGGFSTPWFLQEEPRASQLSYLRLNTNIENKFKLTDRQSSVNINFVYQEC